MRLRAAEPDLQTLINRVLKDEIDLRPDFQRGDVWPQSKKQKLIDTILRDWQVPPIHLIELQETGALEVLDGQQRLAAIRDFMTDQLHVDGNVQPLRSDIMALDECLYSDLPSPVRRRFDRYTLRVIEITDYEPGEPAELFYRLNQPVALTAAEQRNAFFGPAREQVKQIVQEALSAGLSKERLGYSNSRLAYEDVIARFCETIELGSLRVKITSGEVTQRYRSQHGFTDSTVGRARSALLRFGEIISARHRAMRFNKATTYSWLCFLTALAGESDSIPLYQEDMFMQNMLEFFDTAGNLPIISANLSIQLFDNSISPQLVDQLLAAYVDRSTSRVADVSSVLVRDFVIWFVYHAVARRYGAELLRFRNSRPDAIQLVVQSLPVGGDREFVASRLSELLDQLSWGETL